MNPSAIAAALETSTVLRDQAHAARAVILERLDRDNELASATQTLLRALYGAVSSSRRVLESREVGTEYIDALQPLAQSYGFTLSPSLTNSVIITAN